MKRRHLLCAAAVAAIAIGCGPQGPSSDPSGEKSELAGKIKASGQQATATRTVTITQTLTDSQTYTGTTTGTVTHTSTRTQTGTGTTTTTSTRTATGTVTGTLTRTGTSTATATATQTQGNVLSYNQIYVLTGTVTSTNTATAYYAQWPHSQGNTATATTNQFILTTASKAVTSTVTSTFNGTETKTVTATVTGSGTSTGTATVTVTATMTSVSFNAGGGGKTVTATGTATNTATQSWTYHQTATVTRTLTNTTTNTLTATNTITSTVTSTITPTTTSTSTATVTTTDNVTQTVTNTSTSTRTTTSTATQTATGADYGQPCTADADCASGSCSPTMQECQVATIDCSHGSYQLHPFTSLLAIPGTTCPTGLLTAWTLHDATGTCCVNWGPGSCMDGDPSPCAVGQVCADQFCKNDFNQPCTTDAECASGDCSAGAHKCEIASPDCKNGLYDGHQFTSMFAVPTSWSCPTGYLNVWPLAAGDGTCCANWGPGSCFNGDSTPCADNQICSGATCKADLNAACTTDTDCASGSCSPTMHLCQVATIDCNNGSYQGNPFTSLLSVPAGVACPANLLPAWTLHDAAGTCCVNWGPDSCMPEDSARCGAGKDCSNDGHCKTALGQACTADTACASGSCSPTMHLCQVNTVDCSHGSYQLHPFTSLLAVSGTTCPAGLLPAWTLHDAAGTCCVNWGAGSCLDDDPTPCGPNGQCVAEFCKGDYGVDCTDDSQCMSGSCSPTVHKCQVPALDCGNGSYQGHAFTSMLSVPTGATCPAGLLTVWPLGANNGTCCANWGAGSCFDDDASVCGSGGACVNQFCKAGYGAACTANSDCASGSCSPTMHKCQVATIDCNNGSFQGHAFTSLLAIPGTACPAGLFTAWTLHDAPGTCCANWGPGSCQDDSSACSNGQVCSQGLCRGDLNAACWNRTECASKDCSLTAHLCEITSNDCWNGSYQGHPFTSMVAEPVGASCPAGMFEAWPLSDVPGTCCANWGTGSCQDDSSCPAGKVCSQGLCKGDYGALCFSDDACASGSCSPTVHECQVATIDCSHGSFQLHPFTSLLAIPGTTCPTGFFTAWPLHDASGTCCVNWGPGSCMDDSSVCPSGQTCVNEFCQ